MSGFFSTRRMVVGTLLAGVTASTVLFGQSRPSTTTTPAASTSAPAIAVPSTGPAPEMPVDPNAPIAIISGMPINNKVFYDLLMQAAGLRVFQPVFDLVLVQHAMQVAGVPYNDEEFGKAVQAELDRELATLNITSNDASKPVTRDQKLQVLDAVLRQRGLSMAEFMLVVQTRAGLRTLSKGRIPETTPAEVDEAYVSLYGERRTVHIQTLPGDDFAKAAADFRKAVTGEPKKAPEQAAGELKLPAPAVGVIPTNAAGPGVDEIRKAAFDLKVGELSGIITIKNPTGGPDQKVLVMLDKVDPDTRGTTKLTDDLKKELAGRVKDNKENNWMNQHMAMLKSDPSLKIEIKDPYLSQQVAMMLQQQQNAARAATQPAPGTAVPPPATSATAPALK